MTYYKSNKRSHTPISDAAIFFSNRENLERVFKQTEQQEKIEKVTNESLEKVKEILIK